MEDRMSAVSNQSGIVYRNQKKRYPWWVKSVDEPTNEINLEKTTPPSIYKSTALVQRFLHRKDYKEFIKRFPNIGAKRHLGVDTLLKTYEHREALVKKMVQEGIPGSTQKDLALAYAAYSLYYDSYIPLEELTERTSFENMTEKAGVQPWQGTPEEASNIIEKAARVLGAGQIGITTVDPNYMYPLSEGGKQAKPLPPEMKYVIMILTPWLPEGTRRADTGMGFMANRVHTFLEQITSFGLRNFIKGLGYSYTVLHAPWPAFAVISGLGELSRVNRVVSPIYGAGINLYGIVTDLPLAIDKPIDFGLQTFCKKCKRCAEICPVGVVSKKDEPSWEVEGEWNTPGKKVFFEKSKACIAYQIKNHSSCSLCMAVCPWTKQDISVIHRVAKPLSAKFPWAASLMVMMDKIFGYGPTKDPKKLEEWWDLDLPAFGIDTTRKRH